MPQAQPPAYEDAVDLLDADHKLVKTLFLEYTEHTTDGTPAEARKKLAMKICAALTVHATIEEEIFYPAVRQATGDEEMMDEAEQEHAEAKSQIAKVQGMPAEDKGLDDAVKELAEMIDHHVMEEREQVFLKARYAALDLRGMVPELFARKKQLEKSVGNPPAPSHKGTKKKVTA